MKRFIRDWKWVSNSRLDCVDFWCSVTLFISGIFLMFQSPDRFAHLTYFNDPTTTRNVASALFTSVGLVNLIKLFVPLKPPVMFNSALKALNFMLFVVLTLCEVAHLQSFPLTLVFYTVFSGMSFQNLLKTR